MLKAVKRSMTVRPDYSHLEKMIFALICDILFAESYEIYHGILWNKPCKKVNLASMLIFVSKIIFKTSKLSAMRLMITILAIIY